MWDCGNLLDCFFYVQADKSCSVSDLMVCAYIYIYIYIQSNFNGSNTFGTIKSNSRKG